MYWKIINTPLAKFLATSSEDGIRTIDRHFELPTEGLREDNEHLIQLEDQLRQYFSRSLQQFSVELDIVGYTDFQRSVWKELQRIEYGKTISYKELAIRLGDVKKIRAAGTANGKNPIPILIPCHRVIGSDGSMVGYSGGLDMKEFLLQLEGLPMQGKLF